MNWRGQTGSLVSLMSKLWTWRGWVWSFPTASWGLISRGLSSKTWEVLNFLQLKAHKNQTLWIKQNSRKGKRSNFFFHTEWASKGQREGWPVIGGLISDRQYELGKPRLMQLQSEENLCKLMHWCLKLQRRRVENQRSNKPFSALSNSTPEERCMVIVTLTIVISILSILPFTFKIDKIAKICKNLCEICLINLTEVIVVRTFLSSSKVVYISATLAARIAWSTVRANYLL